jgi:hypothetical protein
LNPVFEEPQDFESCDICERTILRGERVTEYLTPDGGRQRVCALCHGRAEAAGWIPASRASALAQWPPPSRGRGLALRERISRAAARVRPPRPSEQPAEVAPPQPAPEEPGPAPATAAGEAARQARPAPSNGNGEAPTRPATPRHRSAAKSSATRSKRSSGERKAAPKRAATPRRETPARRLRHAVETFNTSEESRVVAGLVRSLGQPHATVRNLSARPPRVMITVAWELSWYRWEIDLDGDQASVREVDKGKEVDELDADDRVWNASVAEDGSVRLEAAAARRAASTRGSSDSKRSASSDE